LRNSWSSIYNREGVDRKIEIKLWYCQSTIDFGNNYILIVLSSDLGAEMLWLRGSARNVM
jgi:hypothetical protein